jgi:hypothetical protein
MSNANTTYKNNVIISNNLNVDNGSLYVDVSNSKVGIGTTTPQYELDISGSVRIRTNLVKYGYNAGNISFNTSAIAIGVRAGETNASTASISIGYLAGSVNAATRSVLIGYQAGQTSQATNSIQYNVAIGYQALQTITNIPKNIVAIGSGACSNSSLTGGPDSNIGIGVDA